MPKNIKFTDLSENSSVRSFFIAFSASFLIFYTVSSFSPSINLMHVFFISLFVSGLVFYFTRQEPRFLMAEQTKEIEANLVFFSRALHISLKTGNTLPDAIRNVPSSGHLSVLFRKALIELEKGEDKAIVFGRLSKKTECAYLQRLFAIFMQSEQNILPVLEQYIEEIKRARLRRIHKYELKSELHSRILPLVFIGCSAFVLVSTIVGFYFFSSSLLFVLMLNFVFLPFILILLVRDLKVSNPGI